MKNFALFACFVAYPIALSVSAADGSTTAPEPLPTPTIAIPEAKIDAPRLPSASDFTRPMPAPTFTPPPVRERQYGGEHAYARVVGEAVDFEIVRQLPPGPVQLGDIRIPLFARNTLESDVVLRQAALQLEWGDHSIRDFELVDIPGKNAAPDGVVVYWYMPNSDVRVRYAHVRNPERRMRISFRQPLINGRVVFATALPRIEYLPDTRPWHRQLFIRSLRTNLLGRVSAGVENERLGDGLLILHRDEAYVEIVAAPPTRAAE